MRKLLAICFLVSALVMPSGLSLAQSKRKPKVVAPISLAAQRGADLITAIQLRDYLTFIA